MLLLDFKIKNLKEALDNLKRSQFTTFDEYSDEILKGLALLRKLEDEKKKKPQKSKEVISTKGKKK